MQLLPIHQQLSENGEFAHTPHSQEHLQYTIDFFQRVGYQPPWIGYYASEEGILVGTCAFKGPPVNNTVEIAYGTFEPFQKKGIGSDMCRMLVELALNTDPAVRITARTLAEMNASTRILEKNGFHLLGIVDDPEDGLVWEWEYQPMQSIS